MTGRRGFLAAVLAMVLVRPRRPTPYGRRCSWCGAAGVAAVADLVGWQEGGLECYAPWAYEVACQQHRGRLRERIRWCETRAQAGAYVSERMGARYAALVLQPGGPPWQ